MENYINKSVLTDILKEINQAKNDSLNPKARTKRGGDYRIGLSKAYYIVYDKLKAHNEIERLTEDDECGNWLHNDQIEEYGICTSCKGTKLIKQS